MSGLIAALALFGAIWFLVAAMRAEDERVAHAGDGGRAARLPQPGARDIHTVAPGTLARARVPRWT